MSGSTAGTLLGGGSGGVLGSTRRTSQLEVDASGRRAVLAGSGDWTLENPDHTTELFVIDFTAARYDEAGKKTKNARITVKHNGVVIHDDVELTHGTPGRNPEGPKPDVLFFQDHGNPVVFRNVWVVEK